MKVTYLGHSGFLVETASHYLLFDYYTGKLPVFYPEKNLTVFVSHSHQDHYNKEIFALQDIYRHGPGHIAYVLSGDVHKKQARELVEEQNELLFVKAHESCGLYNGALVIETLKSTDEGVAFVVSVQESLPGSDERFAFYHAGDLNLWTWEGESKAYINNMKANYRREMERIRGREFDAAFVPLDPRLKNTAYGGLDGFLEAARAKAIFPMHFWKQPEIILAYQKARPQVKNIVPLSEEGKSYII